jgi:hypothetical protein
MPLARILAACPSLTTIAFNTDWRIVRPDDDEEDPTAPPLAHDRLTNVGLHGLAYAFGVGYAAGHAQEAPIPAFLVTSANDRTITALCESARFPALRRVRALSRSLLVELDRANGPAEEGGGMARWERWWEECRGAGIRLDDCTGALLGELPQDPPDESESESEEDDDEEEEWKFTVPPTQSVESGLEDLRPLLEECRAMDKGRDDNYMFNDPGIQAIFPGISPVASGSNRSTATLFIDHETIYKGIFLCFLLVFQVAFAYVSSH